MVTFRCATPLLSFSLLVGNEPLVSLPQESTKLLYLACQGGHRDTVAWLLDTFRVDINTSYKVHVAASLVSLCAI